MTSKVSSTFFRSLAEELLSKLGRVNSFTQHTTSIGNYHEEIVRSIIRSMLSERYSVKTGFAYGSAEAVSRQGDILIVDEMEPAPYFFKEGDFVVVHPSAIACIIEVKTRLTKRSFIDAIENIHSFMVAAEKSVPRYPAGTLIYAFDSVSFKPKTLDLWYKSITVPDEQLYYPHLVYSLKQGMLQLKPKTENRGYGHYFLMGEEVDLPKYRTLSIFLATIRKMVEFKAGLRRRNPFEYADFTGLGWSKEHLRYGKGLVLND